MVVRFVSRSKQFADIEVAMKHFITILLIVLCVAMFSCSDTQNSDSEDDGGCAYDEIPGTAVIDSVETAPDDQSNCVDAVEVLFTFTPTDPALPADAEYPFLVGDGKNPNRDWAEAKGLIVGSTHDVLKSEETSGVCTPILYEFTNIDTSDYADSCF